MWGEVDTVYLAFSNAFDMVSHSLLLEKVMCYDPDMWSVWLVGIWLTGCTQRVVVNSSFSNWNLTEVGSPRDPCGAQCCLISSQTIWKMGSSVH